MAEPGGFHRHLDPRSIPSWQAVNKGLLLLLIASPIANVGLLALALTKNLGAGSVVLLSGAAVMELGGLFFLYGLYVCTGAPRQGAIASLALGALLTGFAAIVFSALQMGTWIGVRQPLLEAQSDLEGFFVIFAVGALGAFGLSHLLSVWLISAITRFARPTSSYSSVICYVAVWSICMIASGIVLGMFVLPDHAVWIMRDWLGEGAADIRRIHGQRFISPMLEKIKTTLVIGLVACSVLLSAYFLYLVSRARKALIGMLQTVAPPLLPVRDL